MIKGGNVRKRYWLLVALVLLVAATFWFRFGLGPVVRGVGTRGAFGGEVRSFSNGRMVIADMELTGTPDWKAVLELLRQDPRCRSIEGSGVWAPGGTEKVPFRFQIESTDNPQLRRLELITRFDRRTAALEGTLDLVRQELRADVRAALTEKELRLLGWEMPASIHLRGVVEFHGRMVLAGDPLRLVEPPELYGRFATEGRLEAAPFRMLSPGRFQLGRGEGGDMSLSFPEAEVALPHLVLRKPVFHFFDDGRVAVKAEAGLRPPMQLNLPLQLEGQYQPKSGDWRFQAGTEGAIVLDTPECLARLQSFHLSGEGNRTEGRLAVTATGESLALHAESGDVGLWSGLGVELEARRGFSFDEAGRSGTDSETILLGFRRFELPGGGKERFSADRLKLELERRDGDPAAARFQLQADSVRLEGARRDFTLSEVSCKGFLKAGKGRLEVLSEFSGAAKTLALRYGDWRFQGEQLTFDAAFDRQKEPGEENFRWNIHAGTGQVSWHDTVLNLQNAQWALGAEFRPGDRRPGSWRHRFQGGNGALTAAATSAEFEKGMLELELADTDLAVRAAGLQLEKASGTYRIAPEKMIHGGFSGEWSWHARSFRGSTRRELDGQRGELQLSGGSVSGARRAGPALELSGIELQLPFVPPAAAAAPRGKLTVNAVRGGGDLIGVLQADLTARGTQLSWRGNVRVPLLAGGGFFLTGEMDRKSGMPELFTEFTLPLSQLSRPLPLSRLTGLPGNWQYEGRLGMSGMLRLGAGKLEREWSYELDGNAVAGGTRLTGLRGELREGAGSSKLTFQHLESGNVKTGAGEVLLERDQNGFSLRQATVSAWEGQWRLREPVRIAEKGPWSWPMLATSVSVADLLSLPEWKEAVSGRFSGKLTLGVAGGVLYPAGAELRSDGVTRLRLGGMERYRYVPEEGADPELFEFVAAAWQNFDAQRLQVLLRPRADVRQLRLIADGRPLAPVPFVYENGRFRPVRAGEYGFDGEVAISGDYRLPAVEGGKVQP